MAQTIAKVDFYNKMWESGEVERIICNNKGNKLFETFLNHFKCEPETVDLDTVFDDVVTENKDYKLFYSDWAMCESIYLVKL